MVALSLSAIALLAVMVAEVIGNNHFTAAFSYIFSQQNGRSVSLSQSNKYQGLLPGRPSTLFATSYSEHCEDNGEEEDVEIGAEINMAPLTLDWNLQSLLSSDPSMEARLIPLMHVYDAAATAAEEKAYRMSDDSYGGKDTENNIPSGAPSILPSRTIDDLGSPIGSVQSFSYDGPLSPSVAPYRMFVRDYSRDMGHDGRFTVFNSEDDGSSLVDGENRRTHMSSPSLQSDVVFSMDDPLAFIRDNLSYGGKSKKKVGETVVYIPGLHTAHDPKISSQHCDDLIANNDVGTRTAPERLKYISQVLDGLPIAQIHAGTHIDQGILNIELTSDTINSLISFGLFTETCTNGISLLSSVEENAGYPRKGHYCLRARDLDIIHSVLTRGGSVPLPRSLGDTYLGSDTKGLKDTLVRLIDIAVRSVREEKSSSTSGESPHLVLMTYSATSNVLAAALSEWKNRVTTPIQDSHEHSSTDEHTKSFCRDGVGVGVDERSGGDNLKRTVFSEQEAELLLHRALTVVTISSLSKGFVDGPAYIHVSMNDDPLAECLGITKSNPEGGGKDSIILQALSPYLLDDEDESEASIKSSFIYTNDAHNIDSCVIQYLSLVRRINGITSFREMYNVGIADADSKKLDISVSLFAVDIRSVGQLIIPPRIDCELIPAMIRATGGERWLWNPTFQLGEGGIEGFDSPLPSLEYAQAELENQLGYNSYDEIVENCIH